MKLAHSLFALALFALVISLSAMVASAQGTPTVSFKNPSANQNVAGPDVTINWDSSPDVTIVAAASATALTQGHYHLFLDKTPALQDNVGIPTGDPTIVHTAAKEYKWTGVAPGKHTVTLVLGYSNHTPWLPRTTASLSFNVVAALPATGADTAGGWLLVAGALLMAGLAALGFGSRVRSVR